MIAGAYTETSTNSMQQHNERLPLSLSANIKASSLRRVVHDYLPFRTYTWLVPRMHGNGIKRELRRTRRHGLEISSQSDWVREATHRLMKIIGIVASSPNQSGKNKSATKPNTAKVAQKTFSPSGYFSAFTTLLHRRTCIWRYLRSSPRYREFPRHPITASSARKYRYDGIFTGIAIN